MNKKKDVLNITNTYSTSFEVGKNYIKISMLPSLFNIIFNPNKNNDKLRLEIPQNLNGLVSSIYIEV
jgi:gluconate kinase